MATIAVKNLEAARKFYEGMLGLKRGDERKGALTFKSGKSTIVIYESQYAGTNKATAATWAVPDVERLVAELKSRERSSSITTCRA